MSGAAITPTDVWPWFLSAVDVGRRLTMTLVSKTGTRFTYRLTPWARPAGDQGRGDLYRVEVLTGPEHYDLVGGIYRGAPAAPFSLLLGARASLTDERANSRGRDVEPISAEAPSSAAFKWALTKLMRGAVLAPECEVWHDGTCARCGRTLTTPESVAAGLGPICANRVGEP